MFLFINKPKGMTSHDVVDRVRQITGEKRVGHAGTLDPFATGVLIIGVGRESTRELSKFLKQDKTYRAVVRFGGVSNTDDIEGEIEKRECEPPPYEKVEEVLRQFTGEIDQVPSAYSAIKLKGKKAYELARKGEAPALRPRKVRIYSIKVKRYEFPELEIETKVSSGTYIRALARDIGKALGCGGYLTKLERIAVGTISIEDTISLRDFTKTRC